MRTSFTDLALAFVIVFGCALLLSEIAKPQVSVVRVEKPCPQMDRIKEYSTVELQRLVNARKRMEKVQ